SFRSKCVGYWLNTAGDEEEARSLCPVHSGYGLDQTNRTHARVRLGGLQQRVADRIRRKCVETPQMNDACTMPLAGIQCDVEKFLKILLSVWTHIEVLSV